MSDLSPSERIRRAERAAGALEEFLDPAFDALRGAYQARIEEIASKSPWEAQKIIALANATRILSEVQGQVRAFVFDGAEASNSMLKAQRIENLTPAKKRLLNIGAY